MTDAQFSMIMNKLVEKIQNKTPVDKNNLKGKATRGYASFSSRGIYIINVSGQIAPYFKYVNDYEKHRYRDKNGEVRDGKKNKNYHYFDKALEKGFSGIVKKYGGVIKKNEL